MKNLKHIWGKGYFYGTFLVLGAIFCLVGFNFLEGSEKTTKVTTKKVTDTKKVVPKKQDGDKKKAVVSEKKPQEKKSQEKKTTTLKKDSAAKKNTEKKQTTSPKKSVPIEDETIVPAVKVVNAAPVNVAPQLSLQEIHALSLQQQSAAPGTMPTRSKSIAPLGMASDLFTQSQAHMSVPSVRQLIDSTYHTKRYEKLINNVLKYEKEYADKYVFYHGADNIWRVPQDLYTRLYFYFKKVPIEAQKDFIFLRFEEVQGPPVVKDFLIDEINRSGLINDHSMGLFMISANLALFGNVGVQPECTWQYFIKSRGHTNPNRAMYEKIMDSFGLTHKYIDELMALVDLYQTKEQTILQIFVPKDKVDKIGYLAWIRGIPAHQETMDVVLRSVENKTFSKTAPALNFYSALFKKEHTANPAFKHLIERIEAGEFNLRYFLNFYRNYPDEIAGINNFQARLFFTPEVLLNPLSGVKIVRHSMATPEQLSAYQEKFDELLAKTLSESLQN